MLAPSDIDNWRRWVYRLDLDRPAAASAQEFNVVDQGRSRLLDGDIAGARAAFEEAYNWGTRDVKAEALIMLGDLDRAQNSESSRAYYERASLLCAPGSHNLGIVKHRLATLYEEQQRCGEAWNEYNASGTIWSNLATRHGQLGNRNRFRRYHEHMEVLTAHIKEIAAQLAARPNAEQNEKQEPAPAAPAKPRARRSGPAKPRKSTAGKPRVRKRKTSTEPSTGTWLAAIPIYADLAAGSGLWIADDEQSQSFAEVAFCQIEGKPYELVNLLGESAEIRLARSYLYGLSRVHGNSMNLRGIENDDYVLFRKPRDTVYCPEEGHLVAASIPGLDGRYGVVKRFHIVDGTSPILQSQSTEEHPDIPFDGHQVDPVGQVIAVLKPVK